MKKALHAYRNSLWFKAVAVVAFGLVALCYPGEQIQEMIFPFGVLVSLSGVITILRSRKYEQKAMRWKGIAKIMIGLTALGTASASIFLALIALWAMLTGSFMVERFIKWKGQIPNWQVMFITGLATIMFGLFLTASLVLETVSVTYEIAVFALLLGSSMFYTCSKLKKVYRSVNQYTDKDLSIYH